MLDSHGIHCHAIQCPPWVSSMWSLHMAVGARVSMLNILGKGCMTKVITDGVHGYGYTSDSRCRTRCDAVRKATVVAVSPLHATKLCRPGKAEDIFLWRLIFIHSSPNPWPCPTHDTVGMSRCSFNLQGLSSFVRRGSPENVHRSALVENSTGMVFTEAKEARYGVIEISFPAAHDTWRPQTLTMPDGRCTHLFSSYLVGSLSSFFRRDIIDRV